MTTNFNYYPWNLTAAYSVIIFENENLHFQRLPKLHVTTESRSQFETAIFLMFLETYSVNYSVSWYASKIF